MMGYLTAIRTLLDSLVRILKIIPAIRCELYQEKSFRALIEDVQKNKYKLPSRLKDLIAENREWLLNVIDYRDCLLHYELLSPSVLPYMIVLHSCNSVIAVQTWLPDKPSQSKNKWKFENHVEYLSYAHSTYLHILSFLDKFLNYALDEQKSLSLKSLHGD
jgi:hypothetical protein